MRYWRITCSNGYCGCDEDFYVMAESEHEAWIAGEDCLEENYSFYNPDERFVDMRDYNQIEDYYIGLSYDVEEISKEEFEFDENYG